jgi:DNA polymerase III subunit beta
MKVICTQENLKMGLSMVGRIVSSSNTLPILSNLLIKTENGLLKISSTNLEIAITTQVRCKVEMDGEITVVGKTINELVGNLPNTNITIETKGGELKIEAENYHTSIKTLSAEEFPLIPQVEGGKSFSIDSQELKISLDQVVFAASTNQTQPEISGVLISQGDGELRIAATDRYRLAEKKLSLKGVVANSHDMIVPQKTIAELGRIIGNQKGQVEITSNETQISISFNDTQIVSRLIDGQYPDYKQIIPASFTTLVDTGKSALISALRAVAVFSHSSNSVRFEFSSEKQAVILTTESSELGNSEVSLPSKIEGESKTVILNHHYILDCLGNIDSDMVVMKVIDDNSPSLIVPKDKNDYIYLVMPIKS